METACSTSVLSTLVLEHRSKFCQIFCEIVIIKSYVKTTHERAIGIIGVHGKCFQSI